MDRDGVINRALVRNGRPYPPQNLSELEILPNVKEALSTLKRQGFDLIVVTNQPDVARGTLQRDVIEAMHAKLMAKLPIDRIVSCYHDDADNCECRKPKPGLLLMTAKERGIDLSKSFMVGDRSRDIEAGIAAACRTVFLDYGYAEPSPAAQADYVCGTLLEAAAWITAVQNP